MVLFLLSSLKRAPARHGRNMHPGGNNVLFADGHVACYKRFEATDMTFNPRRMQSWAAPVGE